tara:strand:+ start:52 stop:546 length:495 start_codon:yes stop_codon:yes gene_type:complete
MTPKVYEYKNFLKPTECKYFIEKHSQFFNPDNDKRTFYHRETEIMNIYPFSNTHTRFTYESKKLNGRLDFTMKKIDEEVMVNYYQIVRWPKNSFQEKHIDFKDHCYTSIIYLNDNFEGGETVVEKRKIKPKPGLMVLFSGNQTLHGVNKIKKGNRYTIPCWYTK